MLARALGLNTGATSYHLRELARYGFVEETGRESTRRERRWRAVPVDRRFPRRTRRTPETRLVMDELPPMRTPPASDSSSRPSATARTRTSGGLERAVSVFPVFAAAGATLFGAWAAARISGRRITRIRPAQAMTEAAVESAGSARGRAVAGLAPLAGGAAMIAGPEHPAHRARVASRDVPGRRGAGRRGLPAGPCPRTGSGRAPRGTAPPGRARGRPRPRPRARQGHPEGRGGHPDRPPHRHDLHCPLRPADPRRRGPRAGPRGNPSHLGDRLPGPGVPTAATDPVRRTEAVTAATEIVRTTVRVGLAKYTPQGVTSAGLARTWGPDVTSGTPARFGNDSVAGSEHSRAVNTATR
ncbi:hypothetical protein ACWDZ4_25920 [Streptomyces sp. NPDC003016]